MSLQLAHCDISQGRAISVADAPGLGPRKPRIDALDNYGAKTPHIWNMALPDGVVVSMACW